MEHPAYPPPNGHVDCKTLEQVCAVFLAHCKTHNAPQCANNRGYILRRFCVTHGDMLIQDAKPYHLKMWIDSQKQLGSGWSRKNYCGTVQACFNWAAKLGLISRNPFAGVSERGGKRGRPLEDFEFRAMLRHTSDGLFRRFLLFLYYTGCRPCEAANATWHDLKLQAGKIVLTRHKTDRFGEPRVIYLHPIVVRMLAWIRRHKHHRELIFVNRWGNRWKNPAICSRMKYIRSKSGIPADATCYGLRHRYATQGVLHGVDITTLAQLMGHRRIETTRYYVTLNGRDGHLGSAVEQIFRNPSG